MSRARTVLGISTALALLLAAPVLFAQRGWTEITLNGATIPVSFNDGDSFRIHAGEHDGTQCRVAGFNTLETFGPAHQWGTWRPYELYNVAKQAVRSARRGTWHCTTDGRRDGYGRFLVECTDLAVSLISAGLAHAMRVDDTPSPPAYLEAQREAIAARRGIWAHGAPEFVLTSLHSAAEDPARRSHENRLVSVRDGHSEPISHRDTYAECQWVCHDDERLDEALLDRAVRRMRDDPALARALAGMDEVHLREAAARFARTRTLPAYLPAASRAALEAHLRAADLGALRRERGACMLYVEFSRRQGRERAACLRDHGTAPPPP